MNGICRFCGQFGEGESFQKWVKPTFTDHDKLLSFRIGGKVGSLVAVGCLCVGLFCLWGVAT